MKNFNKNNTSKRNVLVQSYHKNVRTKSDRLGWASFRDSEKANLSELLSEGKEVDFDKDHKALLVP